MKFSGFFLGVHLVLAGACWDPHHSSPARPVVERPTLAHSPTRGTYPCRRDRSGTTSSPASVRPRRAAPPSPRFSRTPKRLSETPDLGVALRRATPRARRPTLTVPRSVWHFFPRRSPVGVGPRRERDGRARSHPPVRGGAPMQHALRSPRARRRRAPPRSTSRTAPVNTPCTPPPSAATPRSSSFSTTKTLRSIFATSASAPLYGPRVTAETRTPRPCSFGSAPIRTPPTPRSSHHSSPPRPTATMPPFARSSPPPRTRWTWTVARCSGAPRCGPPPSGAPRDGVDVTLRRRRSGRAERVRTNRARRGGAEREHGPVSRAFESWREPERRGRGWRDGVVRGGVRRSSGDGRRR